MDAASERPYNTLTNPTDDRRAEARRYGHAAPMGLVVWWVYMRGYAQNDVVRANCCASFFSDIAMSKLLTCHTLQSLKDLP